MCVWGGPTAVCSWGENHSVFSEVFLHHWKLLSNFAFILRLLSMSCSLVFILSRLNPQKLGCSHLQKLFLSLDRQLVWSILTTQVTSLRQMANKEFLFGGSYFALSLSPREYLFFSFSTFHRTQLSSHSDLSCEVQRNKPATE